jgi:GT2 family glycosyltransferase
VKLGVVAIGRNEGERLRACLASALRDCPTVVYVDSGSTDGSVDLARSMGAIIVELDSAVPFTAGRARNEGFAKLPADIDFVQFVDGDCELAVNWISTASAALQAQPSTAIFCGRRREKFPRASVYNHLCDMEWDTPIGKAQACGGDFLIRAAAFRDVGGFDPNVIAGEEPEMCFRLRGKKWSIERLDAEMTLHDAAMTRLSQWWKRNVRSGHAYAQGYAMHGGPPEYWRKRQVQSIQIWAALLPLTIIVLVGVFLLTVPKFWWIGLAPVLLYPVLAAKIAVHRIGRGNGAGEAVLYALAVVLGKFPQYLGVAKFRSAKRHGGRYTIIEYKGPTRPVAQTAHDSRN